MFNLEYNTELFLYAFAYLSSRTVLYACPPWMTQ